MNEIMVSIICTCYNHEKYIKSALDSFLNQKTNFTFEVLVHDDASTDKSAEIIREYERKYPNIIKPVYQLENQYSKGIGIASSYLFPRAAGKYIALCEGDDYWIDQYKLQKQIDFLENNKDYVACVHNTYQENQLINKRRVMFTKRDKELTLADVINGGSVSYHTSSLVYRKEYAFDRPLFTSLMKDVGVGDFPAAVYFALSGRIMYFGEIMSVYRYFTVGSWSARLAANTQREISISMKAIQMLKAANEWSEYAYNSVFSDGILYQEYLMLGYQKKYKDMMSKRYKNIRNSKENFKLVVKLLCPWILKLRELWRNKHLAKMNNSQ